MKSNQINTSRFGLAPPHHHWSAAIQLATCNTKHNTQAPARAASTIIARTIKLRLDHIDACPIKRQGGYRQDTKTTSTLTTPAVKISQVSVQAMLLLENLPKT
jgi:uncharacterized protein YggE